MMDKQSILVVNAEEKTRIWISKSLVECGYQVITARNGQEALEYLEDKPCNLIITDEKVPGMTGIEFLMMVRTIDPKIGVIIVTGHGSVDSYLKLMNMGVFEYLNEPIKKGDIEKVIGNFFNQSPYDTQSH